MGAQSKGKEGIGGDVTGWKSRQGKTHAGRMDEREDKARQECCACLQDVSACVE